MVDQWEPRKLAEELDLSTTVEGDMVDTHSGALPQPFHINSSIFLYHLREYIYRLHPPTFCTISYVLIGLQSGSLSVFATTP